MKLGSFLEHMSPRKKRGALFLLAGVVIGALTKQATAPGGGAGALMYFAAAGGGICTLVGLYILLTKDPPVTFFSDAPALPEREPDRGSKRFVPLADEDAPRTRKKKRKRKDSPTNG